ncbi:MAG: hypothetical protein SGI88_11475 [Candidatus Hydrogenedentes bacterium]|nr:hypothetical protein [Candidatus Hydrogenedentota bacterium]
MLEFRFWILDFRLNSALRRNVTGVAFVLVLVLVLVIDLSHFISPTITRTSKEHNFGYGQKRERDTI